MSKKYIQSQIANQLLIIKNSQNKLSNLEAMENAFDDLSTKYTILNV